MAPRGMRFSAAMCLDAPLTPACGDRYQILSKPVIGEISQNEPGHVHKVILFGDVETDE